MDHLTFFRATPIGLAKLAPALGAVLRDGDDPARMIGALVPLDRAGAGDLSFYDDDLPLDDLRETRAGACLVGPAHLAHVPRATAALVVGNTRDALARVAAMLHPSSFRPGTVVRSSAVDLSARIAETARLEPGVVVDPCVLIGPDVEIGAGTFVGANSVIGAGVRIGRDCAIDAGVTLIHALVGDRVTIQAGARLGLAGDCVWPRAVPSLGRVIVQNDAAIGANTVVPRGRLADTIIGEGARLAALTSIEPDAVIARGAVVGGGRPDARRVSPPDQMV